jgi:hypothetical protein
VNALAQGVNFNLAAGAPASIHRRHSGVLIGTLAFRHSASQAASTATPAVAVLPVYHVDEVVHSDRAAAFTALLLVIVHCDTIGAFGPAAASSRRFSFITAATNTSTICAAVLAPTAGARSRSRIERKPCRCSCARFVWRSGVEQRKNPRRSDRGLDQARAAGQHDIGHRRCPRGSSSGRRFSAASFAVSFMRCNKWSNSRTSAECKPRPAITARTARAAIFSISGLIAACFRLGFSPRSWWSA